MNQILLNYIIIYRIHTVAAPVHKMEEFGVKHVTLVNSSYIHVQFIYTFVISYIM